MQQLLDIPPGEPDVMQQLEDIPPGELDVIEQEVENLPTQRRQEVELEIWRLKQRWRNSEILGNRESIWKEIRMLEDELRGIQKLGIRHFPGVRYKIAVFTFDDPHETGLGDVLAFLLSKRLLFHTAVSSLAVVNFQQGVEPDQSGLGYFEKVDKVTAGQEYFVSVWGRVVEDGSQLVIDTFLQFDPWREGLQFYGELVVPGLDNILTASIQPTRLWIQSIRLDKEARKALVLAADNVRMLRRNPDPASEEIGSLDQGARYWINSRSGDWIEIEFKEGSRGWTSVDVFCTADCARFQRAAKFGSALVRYADSERWSESTHGLLADARAVADQIMILSALRSRTDLRKAYETASEWTTMEAPPGGASFANLRALTSLGQVGQDASANRQEVLRIANDLARASLDDPANQDVLHNLTVLFRFVQDDKRSDLAARLLEEELTRSGSK